MYCERLLTKLRGIMPSMESFYYRDIIIQTYVLQNENSGSEIRAHPVAGQGLSEELNVECSKDMRGKYPIGTFIKLKAKITDREGTLFIYNYYGWGYTVVTEEQAIEFIKKNN